jgi:hypothetical protein
VVMWIHGNAYAVSCRLYLAPDWLFIVVYPDLRGSGQIHYRSKLTQ